MSDPVARLRALDSCAVSDALDTEGVAGVARGLVQMSSSRRIAGRCMTVRLVPDEGTKAPRHLCTAAVEAAGPDDVIVIDHGGRTEVAGWGGILSLAASQRGLAGVVIDGAARDIDESREFDLPVFARAATPTTARRRIVEKEWNVPVTLCAVAVAPGDYVIADGSGVVFVPQDRIDRILATAERIAERERRMAADVRAGRPVSQVMGTDYETMLDGDTK
ncbi:RraA family protein [Sphingomonas sp.]|uniref:RraA family protein n=1 Tax=Sphingomonas sp. TaxID=28214 RepID=UPI002CB49DCC|nr:RraA family protein [Sphingomonas sp.]HWK35442.1 RraA family protein [Sphingomonas sp.]